MTDRELTIKEAIRAELVRQDHEGKPGPYVDFEHGCSTVDGEINLDALAEAVAKALAAEL